MAFPIDEISMNHTFALEYQTTYNQEEEPDNFHLQDQRWVQCPIPSISDSKLLAILESLFEVVEEKLDINNVSRDGRY